ncbi:MAG: SDR family NAD(P)-dependent oxidoreductase [Proteobacteria bacterium]|nr:SDR family NAD(P)-dependent oxidoreductase [Pseudomonadota bacterium]
MSSGDIWLITGASSGIGEAVVQAARASGAEVLALDVNDERGEALARATGAIYQHCDVSQVEDWHAVVHKLSELGAPTHVHLNAGIQIAPPSAPLSEYQFEAATLDRYRRMMGVNVDGVVLGLRALLPTLGNGAAIVVTASLAGITPYSVDPLYAMSKHAVVGLVRSLGPTLAARGIRINALCPGGIDTAIIPEAQRTRDAVFMSTASLAKEVLFLMKVEQTGKSWAKVSEAKPVFIVRAPGDKEGR